MSRSKKFSPAKRTKASVTVYQEAEIIKDCWKQIGVWGRKEPKCPRLSEVIHCRNCDVFTRAGRNLLERELPDKYRLEWTDVMAAKKKEEEFLSSISVVIFRVDGEWLAIRTQVLAEVIDPVSLRSHSLPHRKNPILIGLINIRGEIQLCVSLKELLGIEDNIEKEKKKEKKTYKRMIVMKNINSEKWVFPVDEIYGIHRVHPSKFENVPVTVIKAQSTFTKGIFKWEEKHVAFLDDDLLFFSLARSVQ